MRSQRNKGSQQSQKSLFGDVCAWFRRVWAAAWTGFGTGSTRQYELASMRLRLLAEARPGDVGLRERELAEELRGMREDMRALVASVRSCCVCAKGFPLPNGRWDGGYCCGGTTENVFSQVELASLRASGTEPSDFRMREHEHAGCLFRGPRGCELPAAHRPNLCVRYACRMLRDEFVVRGISEEVKHLASKIHLAFHEFEGLRARRLERERDEVMELSLRGLRRK